MPHFSPEKQGHGDLSWETKEKEDSLTLIKGRASLRRGQINQTLTVPIFSSTMNKATDV